MNVCELAARGPVVLAFVVRRRGGVRAPGRRARAGRSALPRRALRRGRACAATARRCASAAADPGRPRPRRRGGEPLRRRRLPVRDVRASRRRGDGLRADVPRRGRADARAWRRCGDRRRAAMPGRGRRPSSSPARSTRASPQEHPGLAVVAARVPFAPGPTPPEMRERLRRAADRWRGPQAVVLRTRPVPWAYRVLFRHLGIDPDVTRTPVEALVLERLLHGGLRSPRDARRTRWRSRRSRPASRSTRSTPRRVPGRGRDRGRAERLVLADGAGPIAPLFGPPGPDHAPGRRTRALVLVGRRRARGARAVRRGGGVDGGRGAPYS